MGRVSDMAIDKAQEFSDDLMCELDHWKGRAVAAEALLKSLRNHLDIELYKLERTIK